MGNINDTESLMEKKPKDTQLLHAAETGNVQRLKCLLDEASIQVDIPNSSAFTPLFLAAKEGHAECVKTLLDAGARVDGLGEENTALTPIWVATYAGHENCVGHLVEAGANLNTKYPETPLYIAAREGRSACLTLLIGAGSDMDVRNSQGQTPLHIACSELRENCVELLVKAGGAIDTIDRMGCTPLFYACSNASDGHSTIEILVSAGASVNRPCRRHDSRTPLHVCAQRGKVENIKLLLVYGADINVRDGGGCTPKDRAEAYPLCQKVLEECEGYVPPLQKLCGWMLREFLGPKGLQMITHLPIPKALQRFLLNNR